MDMILFVQRYVNGVKNFIASDRPYSGESLCVG